MENIATMCSLLDRVSYTGWVKWELMHSICCSLYRRLQGSALPSIDKDVVFLIAFNETKVDVHLEWLVAFVVWLTTHFDAFFFYWYRKIEKEFPHQVPSIVRILDRLNHEREKDQKQNIVAVS